MGLRTVLFDSHVARKARMVDFGGWDMPVQYDGVIAEHNRVRNDVGMFDTAHMDAVWIEGPGALDAVSRLFTQDLRSLAVGACRYGFMLNEEAGVLDDLIVYRMAVDAFMPIVNAGTAPADYAWMAEHCKGFDCSVRDLRETQGKMDVQGPNAIATVKKVLGLDFSDLKRFRWVRAPSADGELIVSRTGYTGEDGIEIYAPHAAILSIWNKLLEAGVMPSGLGARDTLRLESGMPLYGHEFDTAKSPAEADMMRYCGKAETFIGKEALLRRAENLCCKLAPFVLEGRQTARNGQTVRNAEGEAIGTVTSGSFGPTVGKAIGFAYVKPVYAAAGSSFFIDNGRALLSAAVCPVPFTKNA